MTEREKMIDLIINAKRTDPETESCTEYLADFLLGYGVKLPTSHPGKPLTLEQLREMDGQPVWIVEYPDWGHWELSEDANDYIVDRNLDFYGMKHDDPDGRYGLHKLGWLAYSYPPAHIDRSKWGPCEFCGYTEYPDKKFYPKNGYLFYAGFTKQYAADEFHEEETEDVRYCPKCGRPLTEEAWAELERRLRG